MTTKQQIIARAQAAGSGAKTFRGAVKALRAAIKPGVMYRQQRRISRGPQEVINYVTAARAARLYARYAPLATAQCAAFGLLPRDTTIALEQCGVSATAIRALSRLSVDRRAARIAAWLTAPDQASYAMMPLLALAHDAAESLHAISSQYSSQRATWHNGRETREQTDWQAYAKSYGRPANWIDPAYDVSVKYADGIYTVAARIVSVRGKITMLPLDSRNRYSHPAKLANDLFCRVTADADLVERYDVRGRMVGVALKVGASWEHGADRAECEAETLRKTQLTAERELLAKRAALTALQTARRDRRARLFARLSQVQVGFADVRGAGACAAGISSWCAAHKIPTDATVPLAMLAHDNAARGYALRIAAKVLGA
jgi:hypothetical protein